MISLDKKKCVEVNPVSECISYSLNKCVECNENSLIDFAYDSDVLNTRARELTISN